MKRLLLIAILAALTIACDDGGGGLGCDLDPETSLASTGWPSFRRDAVNSAFTDIVIGSTPTTSCLFPRLGDTQICESLAFCSRSTEVPCTDDSDCPGEQECQILVPSGNAIQTTPVIGENRIFIITQAGEVDVLDFEGDPVPLFFDIDLQATGNTPLIAEDGSFYITSADGTVRRFEEDGELDTTAPLLNFISAAPNMGPEGVVYVGTQGGTFAGVCPNGGFRFNIGATPSSSTAAVTVDPNDRDGRALIVAAGRSGRVQALEHDGDLVWSFNLTSQILSAVIIDEPRNVFYAADANGSVFSGNLGDGARISSFRLGRCSQNTEKSCQTNANCADGEGACIPESVRASMALGANHLYVATEGLAGRGIDSPGVLYAIEISDDDTPGTLIGAPLQWQLPAPGAILSSPAIGASASGEEVIVFGADMEACANDISLPCTVPCDSEPDGECENCAFGQCRRGFVFAVDASGVRWSVGLETAIGASSPSIREPSIDEDKGSSVVYIATQGGRLYEIDTGA